MLYIDASAAAKLLVEESESAALASTLEESRAQGKPWVSSRLLETELRRLAVRGGFSQLLVTEVLATFDLYDIAASIFHEAGVLPGQHLRALDALHVACALRIGATAVVTYDQRLTAAARSLGLEVIAPA